MPDNALSGIMQGSQGAAQPPMTGNDQPQVPTPGTMPPQGGANPLAALLAQGGQGGPPPQPSPSHEQTSAALYHLHEMAQHWQMLMTAPGLGRENIRPAVFTEVSKMYAAGLVTIPQIMNELKNLPKDPTQQKAWVMAHIQKAQQAQAKILNDYRMSHAGEETPPQPSGMAHGDLMSGVMGHYGGGPQ
jgi:hypothetical protein